MTFATERGTRPDPNGMGRWKRGHQRKPALGSGLVPNAIHRESDWHRPTSALPGHKKGRPDIASMPSKIMGRCWGRTKPVLPNVKAIGSGFQQSFVLDIERPPIGLLVFSQAPPEAPIRRTMVRRSAQPSGTAATGSAHAVGLTWNHVRAK